MSLYYSPNPISATRLKAVKREMARKDDITIVQDGTGGFLWVGQDAHHFAPALDPATGVRVLCSGHLSWAAQEWDRAESLPFEGGLGPRLLLDRYLKGGIEAVVPYNGSTIVVVCDPRTSEHHIVTDQFGYHPCFVYARNDADACTVSTFPDGFLADPELCLSYDLVSMAEFVRAWRVTPPNSYFCEVKYAGCASITTVNLDDNSIRTWSYWEPFQSGFFNSITEAADALAKAVQESIEERVAIAKRPVFFISGGADSRVLLFSSDDRAKITGVNIYEHEQEETQIARELCQLAGVKFKALQRDNDYYPRNLEDIVRWSGAMWSAEDSHYPGIEPELSELRPDLVMTACTTDWLFKGYGFEKDYVRFLGKNLPFLRWRNERSEGFLPNVPLPAPPELEQQVTERMAEWFKGCPNVLRNSLDRLTVEDRRIRPACYNVSVSGQVMYRVFPYDTFLADARIAEVYSRTHPDWKLNRELWGKAAAIVCTEAGRIVDSNWGWRVNAGPMEKFFVFAKGWFSRRLKPNAAESKLPDDRPPPSGSWPDYGWYAEHSPTLTSLWNSATEEERERMQIITGKNHWNKPIVQWRHDGQQLFRLMTLLVHWRETERRRVK